MRAMLASITSCCLVLQVLGGTQQSTPDWTNLASCTGVQSGINLKKLHDGTKPLNEPCHSRQHCDGSINCCTTTGTCTAPEGTRGVFVHNKKAYFEGGCSARALDKEHEDYDPDCTQVGECHFAYILKTRNGTAKPGKMTPVSSDIMNRLMAGSDWNQGVQKCISKEAGEDTSYASPLRSAMGFMSLMATFWL